MTSKRPRRSRGSTGSGMEEDQTLSSQSPKVKRTSLSGSGAPITCTLPPTCNGPHTPTILNDRSEFERHYATYHTNICTAPESRRNPTSTRETLCGKVFPDARLLDLHLAECHDPLIAVRKDRGERTFACYVESCDAKFSSPKGRRLHLVDVHKYPKEYYFAVTVKGVGSLLRKWGQGASMIRPEWKQGDPKADHGDDKMDVELSDGSQPSSPVQIPTVAPKSPKASTVKPEAAIQRPVESAAPDEMDSIAAELSSLSLVPHSIRFGRGGNASGLRGRGGKRSAISKEETQNGEFFLATRPGGILGSGKRPASGRATGHGYAVVSREKAVLDEPKSREC